MALETEIAKLVGKLKFEADNRPLLNFKQNIESVKKSLEGLQAQANKKIMLKVGINIADFRAELKKIADAQQIQINKITLGANALQTIRNRIQSVIGSKPIDIKLNAIRISSPQIRLTVDRQGLRSEIQAILAQIQREARIRLDLRGDFGPRPTPRPSPSPRVRDIAAGAGLGSAAYGYARGFIPGLGVSYGISHLNKINQEMQGQQNALTAIMGSEGAGQEQSQWLRKMADTIGIDYRQASPSFAKMLASGQSSGMSTESVQNIFQSVSEYGRVMGLDSESMKGSFKAIEQMMSKTQVMS